MILFVWPPGEPMLAGTGGSETYTAGHVRELLRRGIGTQVMTVLFVNKAYPVPTQRKAAIILHCSVAGATDRARIYKVRPSLLPVCAVLNGGVISGCTLFAHQCSFAIRRSTLWWRCAGQA